MNIVCEQCNTVYRFDTSNIPAHGKKVKCSHCQHVFLLTPNKDQKEQKENVSARSLELSANKELDASNSSNNVSNASSSTSSKSGTLSSNSGVFQASIAVAVESSANIKNASENSGKNDKNGKKKSRLLLRQDSTRYAVNDMATLQRWIVERRVTKDAEISEDGEVWEPVSDRMDLLPFFSIVDRSKKKKIAVDENEAIQQEAEQNALISNSSSDIENSKDNMVSSSAINMISSNTGLISSLNNASLQNTNLNANSNTSIANSVNTANSIDNQTKLDLLNITTNTSTAKSTEQPRTSSDVTHDSNKVSTNEDDSKSFLSYSLYIIVGIAVFSFAAYRLYSDRQESNTVTVTQQQFAQNNNNQELHSVQNAKTEFAGLQKTLSDPPTSENPKVVKLEPIEEPKKKTIIQITPEPTPKPVEKIDTKPVTKTAPKTVSKTTVASIPPKTEQAPKNVSSTTAPSKQVKDEPQLSGNVSQLLKQAKEYTNKHKYEQAVSALKKAAEKSNSANIYSELGWALLNLADTNYSKQREYQMDALQAFQKSVNINSRYASAYHGAGITYMSLGQKTEATKSLKLALDNGLKGDDANEVRSFLQELEGGR